MDLKTQELLRKSLDLIEDMYCLIDSAHLNDEELETLNKPDGLADRSEVLTSKLSKILVSLEKEQLKAT